jgi:hypothetical protein
MTRIFSKGIFRIAIDAFWSFKLIRLEQGIQSGERKLIVSFLQMIAKRYRDMQL